MSIHWAHHGRHSDVCRSINITDNISARLVSRLSVTYLIIIIIIIIIIMQLHSKICMYTAKLALVIFLFTIDWSHPKWR
jgi:hypothetical protein